MYRDRPAPRLRRFCVSAGIGLGCWPLADNDYFSAVDVSRDDAVVIYALFIRHPSPRRYLADSNGGWSANIAAPFGGPW